MSNFLEALPDDIQNLVAVPVALGLAEAFDGEEFLFGRGGEVGYGQEEFFQALQYLTSDQMIQYIGDIEFEAKVLLARIFSNLTKDEQDSLSFSIKSNYEYFEAILKYIDNYGIDSTKNESNRREAINALNHMGYMGFPMTDDGRNLDEILKNYYKVFPKSSK